MPDAPAPAAPAADKPKQDKPLWEYAVGGLFWGLGFFGAALILKKVFINRESTDELEDDFFPELEEPQYEDDEVEDAYYE